MSAALGERGGVAVGPEAPTWPTREGSTELESFLHDLIQMPGSIDVRAEFPWARGSSWRTVKVRISDLAEPLLRSIMRRAAERREAIQGYLARLDAAREEIEAIERHPIPPEMADRLKAAVYARVADIPNAVLAPAAGPGDASNVPENKEPE